MTPAQLRAVADRIRRRYPPPSATMTPGRYVSCESIRALADALDEQAAEEEQADRFFLDRLVYSSDPPRRPLDRFSIRQDGPHWAEISGEEVVQNVRRFAEEAPRMAGKVQAQREAMVLYLREQIPGFQGRLEGPRLFVTRDEFAMLQRFAITAPAVDRPSLLDLDVVVDEGEEP